MGSKKNFVMKKKQTWLILLLLLCLQLGFTNSYIPFSEWFTSEAVYTDDYSFHFADALYKGKYFENYKQLFAYNPYIRAGSISNIIFSVDNFGWSMFVCLFSFLHPGTAFKLFLILFLISVPFLLYRAALNFGEEKRQALLCSLIGTVFLHVSICVDFLYWGSVSYILSGYLSLLIISFFYRYVSKGRLQDLFWFTFLFTAGFWIHLFTALHVLPACVICYVFSFRKLSVKKHVLIGLSVFFVFLLNSIWLVPCLVFLVDYARQERVNFIYASKSLMEPVNTYFFLSSKFNTYANIPFQKNGIVDLLLLLTGITGLVQWRKKGFSCRILLFSGTAGFFFLLAYFGSFLHLTASLTPLRFMVFLNLLLLLPASAGCLKIYDFFLSEKSAGVKAISAGVVLYFLMIFLSTPYSHIFLRKDFLLKTEIPPQIKTLTSWIKSNTTRGGRILVENSDFESNHQYYGTHLPYLFPLLTNRQYLGNYSSYAISSDSYATFYWGYLFNKRIENLKNKEVWPYMDLYNIKWIIVWSKESRKFFSSYPSLYVFRKKIDRFFIYETNREENFFLKGSGTITADINRIEISNIKPEDHEIIISYRWIKYLQTKPETEIQPVTFLKDPGGFIKIKNPPSEITIYNSYKSVFSDWPKIFRLFSSKKKQTE